jgi:hypothetical protein
VKSFCQVIPVDEQGHATQWCVVAPSPFKAVRGVCLGVFTGAYAAQQLADRINALYRVRRAGRSAAAKGEA